MPDLIIHIGFPKCASTTLQNQVFKHEDGYLGTYKGISSINNLPQQFKSLTPAGPRQWSNFSQAKKWTMRVHNQYSDLLPRLILSNEMLSNKNKFKSTPIVSFLDRFSKDIWTSGDVKVIVVLRNYAERLASGYAQVSAVNPNSSQSGFETKVNENLIQGRLHDYAEWISNLYSALGKDNVCVLLMEKIGTESFWQKLKVFSGLEFFEPQSMIRSAKNSNRESNNNWNISPFNPEKKAHAMVSNIFGVFWPYFILKKYRNRTFRFAKMELSKYYEKKYAEANVDRETSFELTKELRHKIQSHFSESTKNLSELLDKDMAALGY